MGVFVRRCSTVICKGQIQNPRNTSGSILDPKNITYITSKIYQFNLTFRTKKKIAARVKIHPKNTGQNFKFETNSTRTQNKKNPSLPYPSDSKKNKGISFLSALKICSQTS